MANKEKISEEQDEVDLRIPSDDRPFFIDLELGFRIYVDQKTYNSYMRPREAEKKKQERRSRCVIGGKRCNGDCSKCSQFRSGTPLSIDAQYERYELEYADQSEDIVEKLAHEELVDAMLREASRLSKDDQRIAYLVNAGESTHEIARIMGIPQRTAYDRVQRILKTLREKLEPYR